MSRVGESVVMKTAFLSLTFLILAGCNAKRNSLPSITFSNVPIARWEGPDDLATIGGRATNVRQGQSIVLYKKVQDLWWVQPFGDRPFTKIQGDSSWKGQTHYGITYAALLVDAGYTPSSTVKTLPAVGGGVEAIATTPGTGRLPPPFPPQKRLHFSGYDWTVRREPSFRGGTANLFESDNAWTDDHGALHLRIAENHHLGDTGQSKWTCAEVELNRNLGYGTYVFTVRDVVHLEPSSVLSLFTWDDQGTEQNRRELDIETSRWGVFDGVNTQFVVQPYYLPSNTFRFDVPAGVVTHSFRWEPGQVSFSTAMGTDEGAKTHVVAQHVFGLGVPSAGGDSVHISLYVFGQGYHPLQKENEVVIEKFEFLP